MFGCIWDRFVTALNSVQMGQSGAINAKDRATNSRRIFSLRTHPIHTMGHKTWNSCFVAFRNVCVYLGSFRYCTKLGAKWAELEQLMKSLCHEVAWEFSIWTHPIHPKAPKTHVLLHFVMFGCIWDRFVTAINSVQNGAELVQLMQKFLPRSRVGTFRYERTRYTPWDPKLMFCCIS